MGLLLVVVVHKASIQERDGAKLLFLRAVQKGFERLELIWAAGGYRGQPMIDWVRQLAGWIFEVIKHGEEATGFVVAQRYHCRASTPLGGRANVCGSAALPLHGWDATGG